MIKYTAFFAFSLLVGLSLYAQQPITYNEQIYKYPKLNDEVTKLYQEGRYAEAIPLAEKIVEEIASTSEKVFYTIYLNNLARIYVAAGHYAEADKLYLQLNQIFKGIPYIKSFPPTEYALFLKNFADFTSKMGRYVESESLYIKANEFYNEYLSKSREYANSLNNLAALYRSMKRYTEAEPLYLKAIEIIKAQRDYSSKQQYSSFRNGLKHNRVERYSRSDPLFQPNSSIEGEQFGEFHIDYVPVLNNLASLYRDMGRYKDAEKIYLRAYKILDRQIGNFVLYGSSWVSDIGLLADLFSGMASLYHEMKHYKKAEVLYEKTKGILNDQVGV